jgi:3-phosphoshikimate 1-carboxyvinyltransferase
LIIDYLRTGNLLPVFENDPNDIRVVYNALTTIDSHKISSNEVCVIDVEDCGAAYRFLMAVLAGTSGKWLLSGTPRLLQRPIIPLVNFLNANGASIEKTGAGWIIKGRELEIDSFEINTDETSQYLSAIMMQKTVNRKQKETSPPFMEGRQPKADGIVKESEQAADKQGSLYNPYIKMTKILMQSPDLRKYYYLSDWSAAAFWIANALLVPNAHYLLKNLHFDGLQGDAEKVKWFEKWGLSFIENENGIVVKRENNVNIDKQIIDVKYTPDIALILAVTAVCYPFELKISGLTNLNLKESHRLDILVNELSNFARIEKHSGDIITINKRTCELPHTFHFDSYNDHRFVMAWSLFKNYGAVNIRNSKCVKKSYPDFTSSNHLIIRSSSSYQSR